MLHISMKMFTLSHYAVTSQVQDSTAERLALAFKLRAPLSADLNLYPQLQRTRPFDVEARSIALRACYDITKGAGFWHNWI